ncbi:MAG: ATP-dependent RecD-like DNA helicase [Erysipelotrichaceae bacterium]
MSDDNKSVNEDISEIVGRVNNYIFHNSESGYSVAILESVDLDEKRITITGYIPKLDYDQVYKFSGNYVNHTKFGLQFNVSSFLKVQLTDNDSLLTLLSGPLFPGIGAKFAQVMIDTLGNDLIENIKADPSVLDGLPKITKKKKEAIINGLTSDNEDFLFHLQSFGLGVRNAMKIQSIYGDRALNILKTNPYQLIEDVDGIGFITADKIAMTLGFKQDDPLRLKALTLATLLKLSINSGDTYVSVSDLEKKLLKFIGLKEIHLFLQELVAEKLVFQIDESLYHHTQFHAEQYTAGFLKTLLSRPTAEIDKKLFDSLLSLVEEEYDISYNTQQKTAIYTAVASNILILTGGPGTGKTTVVKAIASLLKKLNTNHHLVLCAPTGRAAKRLNELTAQETSTIHSLLRWNLETNTFGKNINDPLGYETIIIDECSMVDNWLLYNLFLASEKVNRFIFIGDVNQLPSVGPGKVLKDVIDSKKFTTIELEKIYRQSEGSAIIQLAHDIQYDQNNIVFSNDVKFFDCDQYQVKNLVISLLDNAMDKGYSVFDVQVLACKYSGISGIDNLNHTLQQQFNPSNDQKKELRHGSRIFREADKVLLLKNMVDDNVFNGDIGFIIEINNEVKKYLSTVIVDFDGNIVEFSYENLNNLTLAYCISVHKSQGSEYPIIILAITKNDYFMLDRKLIYTAITRAAKALVLLGDKSLFFSAIKLEEKYQRKTTLKKLLTIDN